MKTNLKPVIFLAFLLIFHLTGKGQNSTEGFTYLRASNCNCLLLTNPNIVSSFTWNGGCTNGYCDGTGTVKYYNSQGSNFETYSGGINMGTKEGTGVISLVNEYGNSYTSYSGSFKNGVYDGYGSLYYDAGNLWYGGYFSRGEFKLEPILLAVARPIGNLVVDSIFEGGTNRLYTLMKAVFSRNNDIVEVQYRLTFNGDIITSNFYDCTLVLKNEPPYINFINCNDNAKAYLVYATVSLGYRLFQELSKSSNE